MTSNILVKRITGNTATYHFSANSGLIIRPDDSGETVMTQYSYYSMMYDRIMYEPESVREVGMVPNSDTEEFEPGFYYGGQAFLLSEFMQDNYMEGVI